MTTNVYNLIYKSRYNSINLKKPLQRKGMASKLWDEVVDNISNLQAFAAAEPISKRFDNSRRLFETPNNDANNWRDNEIARKQEEAKENDMKVTVYSVKKRFTVTIQKLDYSGLRMVKLLVAEWSGFQKVGLETWYVIR